MTLQDEFGIITRNAERRAMYGNRVAHGKAAHVEALPTASTVNPFAKRKPVAVAPPPPLIRVISDDMMNQADRLGSEAMDLNTRLRSSLARATEIEEAARAIVANRSKNRALPMNTILDAVSAAFGVSGGEIIGPARSRTQTLPRFAFCRLAQRHAKVSSTQLGYFLGGRDHTSILNAWKRAEVLMAENDNWRAKYDAAEMLVEANKATT